eukprot:8646511-Pyramimonas_sp.AAC.1
MRRRQNASLRERGASIEWELKQMKGDLHRNECLTMTATSMRKLYGNMGVETLWTKQKMSLHHPR